MRFVVMLGRKRLFSQRAISGAVGVLGIDFKALYFGSYVTAIPVQMTS